MAALDVYRVRIEFKRIQTYLFAVPRLRTILGANALIGETLRQRLAAAAAECGAALPDGFAPPACLNGLACKHISAGVAGQGADALQAWAADDPKASYSKGVLTRDGGHFQALFPGKDQAESFVAKARKSIEEHVPGLMTPMQIEQWVGDGGAVCTADAVGSWKTVPREGENSLQALEEAPGQRPCEWSGQGLGTETIRLSDSVVHVSPLVKNQWDAGTRFRRNGSYDIVGLLQRPMAAGVSRLPCYGEGWSDAEGEDPDHNGGQERSPDRPVGKRRPLGDLTSLAGGKGRYLALVHVDGNGVGKRTPKLDDTKQGRQSFEDWFEHEAKVEAFFASMRQQVRQALVTALRATFGGLKPGVRPYQLLMLGGDDLLLACQAEYALPFVVRYAEELEPLNLADDEPLDVGAGVAIAQPTFPFHALHALAEELASSAKRLSRACPGQSVVDWMVVTNASVPDPSAHRRRHDWVRYRPGADASIEELVLNARPYFVLDDGDRTHSQGKPSLQKLLRAADALRAGRVVAGRDVARSQLKQLPGALRAGRRAGVHAFNVLPKPIRDVLKEHGIAQAWTSLHAPGAAADTPAAAWYTCLADLVEVSEIPDLGHKPPSDGRAADAAHVGAPPGADAVGAGQ